MTAREKGLEKDPLFLEDLEEVIYEEIIILIEVEEDDDEEW